MNSNEYWIEKEKYSDNNVYLNDIYRIYTLSFCIIMSIVYILMYIIYTKSYIGIISVFIFFIIFYLYDRFRYLTYGVVINQNEMLFYKYIRILNKYVKYSCNICDLQIVDDNLKLIDSWSGCYIIIIDKKKKKEFRIPSIISRYDELNLKLINIIDNKTKINYMFWEKTKKSNEQ